MLLHGGVDHVVFAESTEALAGLLLQAVVSAPFRTSDPSGAAQVKPLLGGLFGFHFGH
jgi:hypothetical protein